MKKLFLLFVTIVTLIACGDKKAVYEPIVLDENEKEMAADIMKLYANVDSALLEERNRFYQLLLKHSSSGDEPTDEERGYFLRNVAHIDSIVARGVELAGSNKGDELMALVEGELTKFYSHPHNNIDNEIALHGLLSTLYHKKGMPADTFFTKLISLYTWSALHCEMLEPRPVYYTDLLINVLDCNIMLEQYGAAVQCGEKLSLYAQQTNDQEAQVYSTVLLGYSYGKENKPHLADSCSKSIEHLVPLYPVAHEHAWDLLNR